MAVAVLVVGCGNLFSCLGYAVGLLGIGSAYFLAYFCSYLPSYFLVMLNIFFPSPLPNMNLLPPKVAVEPPKDPRRGYVFFPAYPVGAGVVALLPNNPWNPVPLFYYFEDVELKTPNSGLVYFV